MAMNAAKSQATFMVPKTQDWCKLNLPSQLIRLHGTGPINDEVEDQLVKSLLGYGGATLPCMRGTGCFSSSFLGALLFLAHFHRGHFSWLNPLQNVKNILISESKFLYILYLFIYLNWYFITNRTISTNTQITSIDKHNRTKLQIK